MGKYIFETVGYVMVFLFAGIGMSTLALWVVGKFLTYVIKTLKVWKLFIDFIFDYKQFKQWKNEQSTIKKD